MRRLMLGVLLLAAVAATADAAPPLRGWYLGLQLARAERDRYDVYGRPDLPPAPVAPAGRGGGLVAGHRFGDRFLLGLQMVFTSHDLEGSDERLHDGEALVTGTVLFRERETLQPFLRGGFGGAALVVEHPQNAFTVALGTAAIAGAGAQVRLSGRFSLEAELAATFTNVLHVEHDGGDAGPDDDWRVRASQTGWRAGIGLHFWF